MPYNKGDNHQRKEIKMEKQIGPGRPRNKKRTEEVRALIAPELKEWAVQYSYDEDVSLAWTLNKALQEYAGARGLKV
jgi:hypothetical protein